MRLDDSIATGVVPQKGQQGRTPIRTYRYQEPPDEADENACNCSRIDESRKTRAAS